MATFPLPWGCRTKQIAILKKNGFHKHVYDSRKLERQVSATAKTSKHEISLTKQQHFFTFIALIACQLVNNSCLDTSHKIFAYAVNLSMPLGFFRKRLGMFPKTIQAYNNYLRYTVKMVVGITQQWIIIRRSCNILTTCLLKPSDVLQNIRATFDDMKAFMS